MRTLPLLLVFLSSPALFAQVGDGVGPGDVGVSLCMKIIDYTCPPVDESPCPNSTNCSYNNASPPVLECRAESESRSLGEQPGATTDPQAWEAGTTKVKETSDAYCFQVRACPTNCIVVLIDGVEVKKCGASSGTWNDSGAVYKVLVEDGNFCHP